MRPEPFLIQLQGLLPDRWKVDFSAAMPEQRSRGADGRLTISAPDGSVASLFVELKSRLSARQAQEVAAEAEGWGASNQAGDGLIVLTRFASSMARQRLREWGISYLDLTGNAWITVDKPSIYLERQGAATDPDPPRRGVRSLKGPKAGRLVRGLCDWLPPLGVRELARRTGINPGYVTRVLSLLGEEDLIERDETGEVTVVLWKDLLMRWSRDYSVLKSNRAVQYLAPRGLPLLLGQLSAFQESYAVTGSFAVPAGAQVAPGRVLACYAPSPEAAGEQLDLVRTDAGANVILLEPFDPVVFERTRRIEGTTTVAITQLVVDLVTGTGREPAQAEALLTWMSENEDAWRT